MSLAFIGEVRLMAFGFAPLNWAACNGALMPISQNTQLFAVIGNLYGGNGTSNFALPNFQNNVVVGAGTAVTGTQYAPGATGGTSGELLNVTNNPPHTHLWQGTGGRSVIGSGNAPGPKVSLTTATGCSPYLPTTATPTMAKLAPLALSPFGTLQPTLHNNMMPTVALNFCICLSGVFPSRT
jgi:microcystin-dependent protein